MTEQDIARLENELNRACTALTEATKRLSEASLIFDKSITSAAQHYQRARTDFQDAQKALVKFPERLEFFIELVRELVFDKRYVQAKKRKQKRGRQRRPGKVP